MTKRSSFGVCGLCGARKGKAAMLPHLRRCVAAQFPANGARSVGTLLLLQVGSSGAPMYWLDLAAPGEARLREIDGLLRKVWLECCGHLSEFSTGRREVGMGARIGNAFRLVGSRLDYVYDFGSSTELVVRLAGIIEGHPGNAVQVVARNEPPAWTCDVCGAPATAVCVQCVYENEGFLCVEHASDHACGEDMLLPVVNSPRMGVCGYTGQVRP